MHNNGALDFQQIKYLLNKVQQIKYLLNKEDYLLMIGAKDESVL